MEVSPPICHFGLRWGALTSFGRHVDRAGPLDTIRAYPYELVASCGLFAAAGALHRGHLLVLLVVLPYPSRPSGSAGQTALRCPGSTSWIPMKQQHGRC